MEASCFSVARMTPSLVTTPNSKGKYRWTNQSCWWPRLRIRSAAAFRQEWRWWFSGRICGTFKNILNYNPLLQAQIYHHIPPSTHMQLSNKMTSKSEHVYKCEQVIYFNIFIRIYILNGRAEGRWERGQSRTGNYRGKNHQDQWLGRHQEVLQGKVTRQGRVRQVLRNHQPRHQTSLCGQDHRQELPQPLQGQTESNQSLI